MFGRLIPTSAGARLEYHDLGLPLAVYTPSVDKGPVTVQWKGSVDVLQLRDFFADATRTIFQGYDLHYRRRVLTPNGRGMEETSDEPSLAGLRSDVRFVRFECTPATASNAGGMEAESTPVFIAWAILDEPEYASQESMGIYTQREYIAPLLSKIESFIARTALSQSFVQGSELAADRAKEVLSALKNDLSN